MDGVSKRKKSMIEGQLSLFGEMEMDVPPPPLPPLPELPKKALLDMEKEVAGVYVSGHPLDEFREELSRLEVNAGFLAALADEHEDKGLSLDGMSVAMGGLITERKMKATRKGDMMAFITLEDLFGSTEVLVFPRVFERCRAELSGEEAVLLRGKLSIREDDAPKLILDSVVPLRHGAQLTAEPLPPPEMTPAVPPERAEARPVNKRLYLRVKNEFQRNQAADLLVKTPGSYVVTFYVADEGKAYQAPRELWVSEAVDLISLREYLGEENVVFKTSQGGAR